MTLTPRQLEVARLLHDGLRPKQIADRLGIALSTVHAHKALAAARIGGDGPPTVIITRYFAVQYARHS